MPSNAVPCTTEQTQLGEGTRWDERYSELLRVDILAGRVYRDKIDNDGALSPVQIHEVPGTVGAIAPIADDDGWLLAAGRTISYLRPGGELRLIAEVAAEGTRMNDAACDPQGRFWTGTLANDQRPGGGSLYRLERNGSTELMLDELTISNGLGWSPDSRTMYLTDSGPGVIHAFRFDPERGTISDDRLFVDVPDEIGSPDGLTVDAGETYGSRSTGAGGSSATLRRAICARSCSCQPNKPPAVRSQGPGCIGSMSRRRPNTGPMNSVGPSPALGWCTGSTRTRPVSLRLRSVRIQPGGRP
jgi:sugar lactone lactonase YvrE